MPKQVKPQAPHVICFFFALAKVNSTGESQSMHVSAVRIATFSWINSLQLHDSCETDFLGQIAFDRIVLQDSVGQGVPDLPSSLIVYCVNRASATLSRVFRDVGPLRHVNQNWELQVLSFPVSSCVQLVLPQVTAHVYQVGFFGPDKHYMALLGTLSVYWGKSRGIFFCDGLGNPGWTISGWIRRVHWLGVMAAN